MAKAKKAIKTEKHVNGKHGEVIEVEKINEMEKYLSTAKDLLVSHDDDIEDIKRDIKAISVKIDRALSRLGIS